MPQAPSQTPITTDLSTEETRQVLTPFAFKVDQSLFGLALAAPWRRLAALLVDLFFIAILSGAPGELLAIVIAYTFYQLGSKKRAQQQGKVVGAKRRAIMRFIGAFIVFMILLSLLPLAVDEAENILSDEITNKQTSGIDGKEIGFAKAIEMSALALSISQAMEKAQCTELDCYHQILSPYINDLQALALDEQVAKSGIEEVVENTDLAATDKTTLLNKLLLEYQAPADLDKSISSNPSSAAVTTLANDIDSEISSKTNTSAGDEKPVYSIIQLVKGIISDLGLGFGWAAFYFTIFTALWHGQTPGKKLFYIKVLQLDGTPLSMWDSFGRYGGYGAGIATGLIGFIQIFWDANRQAIHDKISATVVINANSVIENKDSKS
ncbi:RDD family protein [Thalassotalea sp. PLHSN55]|uniref:RDD family protein n=1 Tax=Thalassotalea sp. PLHSN55 TaxID=3435888 RepID=UPI003F876745